VFTCMIIDIDIDVNVHTCINDRYRYIDIELHPAALTSSACEEGNQAAAAQVAKLLCMYLNV